LFGLVAARHLGSAQAQPAVALSFEKRRVRDYLSPLAETLMAALLVAGWYVLVIRGDANVRWAAPVVATYVVMALLVAKIMMIRAGTPLPPDRTEEHHRYFEAGRRYGLRVVDAARWFFAFLVAGYAVLHGGRDSTTSGLQWSLVAVALAIWLGLVVTIVRGAQRLDVMGRSLRPLGSWAGPFLRHRPRRVVRGLRILNRARACREHISPAAPPRSWRCRSSSSASSPRRKVAA
jgi:hypothetical protein